MATPDPLALVGTTIADKYEIERVVGQGGFAIVYRATHNVWKRPVAIKVFRALGSLPHDRKEALVRDFLQEGALLAELSERSAAFCQARDVGNLRTKDGTEMPYTVLEWLEGRTLEEVLDDEKRRGAPARNIEDAVNLLEPVAHALALAHKKRIAHRDVKPANIFVIGEPRGERTVKLLDFGIAKVVQDAAQLGETQGGMSSFTPAYGAPEQFSRANGATGLSTDVFALALVFTEVLTQKEPLQGDDLTQLAVASMDPRKRPTPRTFGTDTSDAVNAVLERALAVRPEERFPTAGEFWNALRRALSLETMPGMAGDAGSTVPVPVPASRGASAAPTAAPTGEAPRSVAVLFGGLGAAVVLAAGLVAGGAWYFGLRGKDAVMPPSSATASAASAASASASAAAVVPPACPAGMTLIPGGKFFMGSDERKDEENERPAHQVTLSPYCVDTYEVTVEKYKACSDRGECRRAPAENDWPGIGAHDHKVYDPLCNIREPDKRAQHPINCLDWTLATAYCEAQGLRLPTEAEWEFATRGSDGRRYPWGDDPPNKGGHLNACGKECVAWGRKNGEDVEAMYPLDDGWPNTAPVGSFPKGASPFGLEDVVGNVWEWTRDWYAPYAGSPGVDPKGPDEGTERVLRGGAWNGSDPSWVRPTYRFKAMPTLRSHGIGMRCARDLVTRDR